MERRPIYLDHNATTPVAPEVFDAMVPFLREHFGNPSSAHAYGRVARAAVEQAREEVAALLGAEASEIVFTSGGTEANNAAIFGVARGRDHRGRHLVTTAIEHPAVVEPLRRLERDGFQVSWIDVDRQGRVAVDRVARALHLETTLVTVMHANNEVGTVQPVGEIAEIAHGRGVIVHTDAAQSVGKIPCDVGDLGVDLLTVAGHKLHAPKGVGALYVRKGLDLPRWMFGAGQERGRRAGTENVPEIVGLGRAAVLARERLAAGPGALARLRDRLWDALAASELDVRRNGGSEPCLPNTLSVGFRGVEAGALLRAVEETVAASAGAACHAEGVSISETLKAMRVPERHARGTLRLSLGHETREAEVDEAARVLIEAARRLASHALPDTPDGGRGDQ